MVSHLPDTSNARIGSEGTSSFLYVAQSFFSSSVADVALMARSLHESKQKIHCTRTKSPWNQQIDWSKKTKTHNHTKSDDPQIPQPHLRFASGNSEAIFCGRRHCLSTGHHTWGLPADQRGIEPPPVVCPNYSTGTPQRKQRSKQQKKQQNPKNGARAQTKTPTESICHWTQWQIHCITIKSMQKMNYVSQLPRQTWRP